MEIEKERMSVFKNKEGSNNKSNQVFKVFTRQVSRFAFPPNLPRPRIDYDKSVKVNLEKDSKGEIVEIKDKKEKKIRRIRINEGKIRSERTFEAEVEAETEVMQDVLGDDELRDEIDGTSYKRING